MGVYFATDRFGVRHKLVSTWYGPPSLADLRPAFTSEQQDRMERAYKDWLFAAYGRSEPSDVRSLDRGADTRPAYVVESLGPGKMKWRTAAGAIIHSHWYRPPYDYGAMGDRIRASKAAKAA